MSVLKAGIGMFDLVRFRNAKRLDSIYDGALKKNLNEIKYLAKQERVSLTFEATKAEEGLCDSIIVVQPLNKSGKLDVFTYLKNLINGKRMEYYSHSRKPLENVNTAIYKFYEGKTIV